MLLQSLLNTTKQVVDGVLNKGEKQDPRDVVSFLLRAQHSNMHTQGQECHHK